MTPSQKELLSRAGDLAPWLLDVRRQLHRCPEPGNGEFHTSEIIQRELHALGIETCRLTETAVMGTLRFAKPGKTAALRADMDALPITEDTAASFASENVGWMHACGHDFHMSAALGCAALLSERKDALSGCVKFFFQPDEEGNGGARRMIDAGCLENPHVDAVFGAHVAPALPAGMVGIRYGKFYAASNPFNITLHGRSSHGAQPELGIDALSAGAKLVCALAQLRADLIEKHGPTIISVGSLHSGSARNIIADTAQLCGIIRTLGPSARQEAIDGVHEVVRAIERETGVRADVEIIESYPGVVNHDSMSRLVEDTARSMLGDEAVALIENPSLTTEDFGYFIENTPGCFYHIGVGGDVPLHNGRFLPDENLLPTASAVHAAVIEAFLEEHRPDILEV
jgi:amidohydrolase